MGGGEGNFALEDDSTGKALASWCHEKRSSQSEEQLEMMLLTSMKYLAKLYGG